MKENCKKKVFILDMFLILFVLCFVFFTVPNGGKTNANSKISSMSWMSNIDDNKSLRDMNIPGTHDSGTKYTAGGVTGIVASCQDLSISEQLESGIRYLDIRLDSDLDVNHGGIVCYTSFWTSSKYKLTFKKVLKYITDFLKNHETETVIIQIKPEGAMKKNKNFLKKLNNLLSDSKYDNYLYQGNKRITKLTLGDIRGKFVIFSRNDHPTDAYRYYNWADNCLNSEARLDSDIVCLQDYYSAKKSTEKMECIENFYNDIWQDKNLDSKFIVNFNSCVGPYCPEYVAGRVNPKFEEFFDKNNHKKFGIILMDDPDKNLISKIYMSNINT